MPKPSLPRLAERVRARRIWLGLTQFEVAVNAGVSLATIQRLERASHAPYHASLEAIAEALHCTVDELTGEEVPAA